MGKHEFYNGENLKILKSNFWPEKYINMDPQYTKRCRIATFRGVRFLRNVYFLHIFIRKSRSQIFEISIELHCNLKNLKSGFSHENIEKINISQKTYPQRLLICIFGILWTHIDKYFWPEIGFTIFGFPPIILGGGGSENLHSAPPKPNTRTKNNPFCLNNLYLLSQKKS